MKITKKELIENRIKQINDELNSIYENKYSNSANKFIGNEISHLEKDKGYSHDRAVAAAINIAKEKGYKVPSNESSVGKKISIEKLLNIAKNAGDIVTDAESELNNLSVAYANGEVPLDRVIEILSNYDIDFKDVNVKRKKESKKWMSIEDMINRGLLERNQLNEVIERVNKLLEIANKVISKKNK